MRRIALALLAISLLAACALCLDLPGAGPHQAAEELAAGKVRADHGKVLFGRAVLLARIHESENRGRAVCGSGFVHQSSRRRARSGSANPRRSSISANVRTTVFANRFSR